MERSVFVAEIERPIAAHLLQQRLQDQILILVLTKGVPLKILGTFGPTGTAASVDSELTLLYRTLVLGPGNLEGSVDNPYFHPQKPAPFNRADYDVYLVTRLDGYDWDDVRGLIDRRSIPRDAAGSFSKSSRRGRGAAPPKPTGG